MLMRLLFLACLVFSSSLYGQTETVLDETIEPGSSVVSPIVASVDTSAGSSSTLLSSPSAKPAIGVGSGLTTTNPLTVIFGLVFVVLLIAGCAWLMKRVGGINVGGVSGMKIVAGLSVGPREKVLLVEVGDRQVLIGVAPGRVSHLQSFDQLVIDNSNTAPGEFSRRLKSLMTPAADKGGDKS